MRSVREADDIYQGNYEYLGDPTPSTRSTKLSDLPIPRSLESSNILDDSLEGFRNIHWKVGNSGIATKGI